MAETRSRFLRILRIETEELGRDIAALMQFYERKRSEREITNYVYLENVALIRHEVACLEQLQRELDRLDPQAFPDLPALIREIEGLLDGIVRGGSLPDFIAGIVRRRIEKASRYVLEP